MQQGQEEKKKGTRTSTSTSTSTKYKEKKAKTQQITAKIKQTLQCRARGRDRTGRDVQQTTNTEYTYSEYMSVVSLAHVPDVHGLPRGVVRHPPLSKETLHFQLMNR